MQSARWLLPIVLLLGSCGGGKSAAVPRLAETEPNDTEGTATVVTRNWSSIHLGGDCSSASDQDWWAITFATYVPPAPMTATLSWSGGATLDLFLYSDLGAPLSSDTGTTSPAVVSMNLTTSGSFVLEVRCNAATGTSWKLDIPAPGANPSE